MSYFGHWKLKVRYAGLTQLLFLIGWIPIFEWCAGRCGSKNQPQNAFVEMRVDCVLRFCQPF